MAMLHRDLPDNLVTTLSQPTYALCVKPAWSNYTILDASPAAKPHAFLVCPAEHSLMC